MDLQIKQCGFGRTQQGWRGLSRSNNCGASLGIWVWIPGLPQSWVQQRTPAVLELGHHDRSKRTHTHGNAHTKGEKLLKKRSQEHKRWKKYVSWAVRRFSPLRHLPTTWWPKLIPWNPRDKNSLSSCPLTVVRVCVSGVKIIICLSFCVFASCEYIKTLLPGNDTNDICSWSCTLWRAYRDPKSM